mmetsp:Transcript_15450/g.19619  ORF Transcript_15450/g.19619 Transcript_15450/m.19619 type:complete len:196 (+) Transcript_15450:48-635(+)
MSYSIQNYDPTINEADVDGMWVDEDLTDFVDCFSFEALVNSADPDFLGSGEVLNWDEPSGCHSNQRNKRRFSLLGCDSTEAAFKKTASQSRFEDLHRCNERQQAPLVPDEPFLTNKLDAGLLQDMESSTSDEFKKQFKQGLSKLEQSMKRTEESRKMLSQQRPAISVSSLLEGASSTKGQYQLLSYVSQIRNSTM